MDEKFGHTNPTPAPAKVNSTLTLSFRTGEHMDTAATFINALTNQGIRFNAEVSCGDLIITLT